MAQYIELRRIYIYANLDRVRPQWVKNWKFCYWSFLNHLLTDLLIFRIVLFSTCKQLYIKVMLNILWGLHAGVMTPVSWPPCHDVYVMTPAPWRMSHGTCAAMPLFRSRCLDHDVTWRLCLKAHSHRVYNIPSLKSLCQQTIEATTGEVYH